uniref:Uncharacterized protein n=1 Tax=Amphilophus citrinellus TaxID=61819 RepID=A0A3Q0T375_AMPCI
MAAFSKYLTARNSSIAGSILFVLVLLKRMAKKTEQLWTRFSSSESSGLYGSWCLVFSAWRYD